MKKVTETMTVVALLFISTSLLANEPKLITDNTSKSIVFQGEDYMEYTSISFIDSEKNTIYSDFVKSVEDYSKKFNLETLTHGNYFLVIDNKLKKITYTIQISKNGILVLNEDHKIKPVFRNVAGIIYLNYLNLSKKPVDVIVYDSFGRRLFKETFKNDLSVAKVFNFKDAFEDKYSIVVKSDSELFYESISVK